MKAFHGSYTALAVKTLAVFAVFVFGFTPSAYAATNAAIADEIAEKNRQIEELQRQIEEYQQQIDANRSKSATLSGEIQKLNAQISQFTLEIRSLGVSIDQTGLEIRDTETKITDANKQLDRHKLALAQYLRLTYNDDQTSLTEILLNHSALSDFFSDVYHTQQTQENIRLTIEDVKDLKLDLDTHKDKLEGKKTDLERLKQLQEIERRNLDLNKGQKDRILKETKGQEARYQEMVKQTKQDLDRLREQVYYLQQNGISVEDAVKYAQLAAIRTGIRPAYLLAELEQESGLGANVGKCYITDTTTGASRHITNGKVFARGIHPTRDLALFLTIVKELGKDPMQTPISCWPGTGWGGAMGPAQFIPSTWMGYREEVARLTGRTPANPWNIEDAFVAAAAKLSRDGANSKTKAGEIAASKRYYCGSSTSRSAGCINYANSVQRLADEISKNL